MTEINLNLLNNVEEAKAAKYNGKQLTKDFEKNIFNHTLLSPNGNLDISLLRETALLLEKVKKAEEMSTSDTAAQLLLNSLRKESNSQSVLYRVVNSGNSQVDREIIHLTTLLGQSPNRYNNKTKEEWQSELETKDLLLKQLEKELEDEEKIVSSYAETTGRLKREREDAREMIESIKLVINKVKANATLNAFLKKSKQKNEKVWTYAIDPKDKGFFEIRVGYGEPKFLT